MAEFRRVSGGTGGEDLHMVGLLPTESLALSFRDHLESLGMPAVARVSLSGRFEILVRDSAHVSAAKRELIRFAQTPLGRHYRQTSWEQGREHRPQRRLGGYLDALQNFRLASLTTFIEVACVVVFILLYVDRRGVLGALGLFAGSSLADPMTYVHFVTPVFLHFGIIHLLFNLVMFEAFARKLEKLLGWLRYVVLFVLLAAVSNYLQYLFMNPQGVFGGLSGVVYGFIAYAAMLATRPQLAAQLQFPRGMLVVSALFVAFGFLIDGVANFCHLGGLLLGLALGVLDRYLIRA